MAPFPSSSPPPMMNGGGLGLGGESPTRRAGNGSRPVSERKGLPNVFSASASASGPTAAAGGVLGAKDEGGAEVEEGIDLVK